MSSIRTVSLRDFGDRPEWESRVTVGDNYKVISFSGMLKPQAEEVEDIFSVQIRAGEQNLVADLSSVTFIDSAGIGQLVVASALLRQASGNRLVLCGVSDALANLRVISEMIADVFEIYQTREEALKSFR